MIRSMESSWSRRRFIAAGLAGAGTLVRAGSVPAADPPPEVTHVRFVRTPAICFVPQFVAEEFLRLEGFTQVEQVPLRGTIPETLVEAADFAMFGGPSILPPIDSGMPLLVLAGIHVGCWKLLAHEHIASIRDLRGRKVAIMAFGGVDHIWLSSIFSYIGVDPRTDIDWVLSGNMANSAREFVSGRADAFLAFPPQPQELQAAGTGKILVDTVTDKPFNRYFCCLWTGTRAFVDRYPVATKRVLRALLKATDLCARSPEQAARYMTDKGYEPRYHIALQVLRELPYDQWRTLNPADSLRFHALRLKDVGMIKSTPDRILERGTDWRFLNALKRETKA